MDADYNQPAIPAEIGQIKIANASVVLFVP